MSNQERAERARKTLVAYMNLESFAADILDECTLSDFLADAMHLLGRDEVRKAVDRAETHYSAELEDSTDD